MASKDAVPVITASVAASGTVTIQPGVGVEWVVTDWGSSQWIGGGGAQSGYPNMDVEAYDASAGVWAAVFYRARVRAVAGFKNIVLSNTDYGRLTNASGSTAALYYSATVK